jgi:hypothetical protein
MGHEPKLNTNATKKLHRNFSPCMLRTKEIEPPRKCGRTRHEIKLRIPHIVIKDPRSCKAREGQHKKGMKEQIYDTAHPLDWVHTISEILPEFLGPNCCGSTTSRGRGRSTIVSFRRTQKWERFRNCIVRGRLDAIVNTGGR